MSRRQKRLQDMRESKARRMKIVAIGGAVVLAALLAWELPHYLGGKKSSAPAETTSAAVTTPGSPTTPGTTTPAPGTAAAAVAPTAKTKLPNSDVAPRRTKSQLASFSTFRGGDPFVPQVSLPTTSPDGSAGSSPAASPSAPSSSGVSTVAAQQASVRTLARAGSVTVAVNGKTEVVRVGASFPSSNPVFKLVSLTSGAANIGIANGSYTSGAHTVRLSSGRTLTLVDTADGVRYTLRLLP
jgi:hypothetical protein